ncbi:MAG: hypothetical protein WD894_08685 [Pirellulales bacterium]
MTTSNTACRLVFAVIIALDPCLAFAVSPGQVDDFEQGTQGWGEAGRSPNQPRRVATGGNPGGYLENVSSGSTSPGGRLIMYNQQQWRGNYPQADIEAIQMDLKNFEGSTDPVFMRIALEGTGGTQFSSTDPFVLPTDGAWHTALFGLSGSDLTRIGGAGTLDAVLANVTTLRVLGARTGPAWRGDPIRAQIGVDNISVWPVPTWNVDADGNWSLADNWIGSVPNSRGRRAVLGSVINQPRTVTLDVPITLGRLDFDSTNAYTVAGANSLMLDVTTGNAQINVTRGSHTIRAPVTLADNTVISVSPADSSLSISGSVNSAGNNVAKTGAGTLAVNRIQAAGLSINAGKVQIAPDPGAPGSGPSVLGALAIAGGTAPTATLDLNNGAAIIDYSGGSPAAMIRQQILAGRGSSGLGASWNGKGIASSEAAEVNTTEPETRSIGYADNSALPLGAYTSFHGQPVDDTALLMAFTRTGDANLDGVVNDDDVTIVSATYAPGVSQPNWALGDFDYNGFVDDDDVTLLGVFYDPAATPIALSMSEMSSQPEAVPEPASHLLLISAFGVLLIAVRRTARAASTTN